MGVSNIGTNMLPKMGALRHPYALVFQRGVASSAKLDPVQVISKKIMTRNVTLKIVGSTVV